MTSANDTEARGHGRAERGMELTLLAVKFQIALAIPSLFFGFVLGLINLLVLIAVYFGLRNRLTWVALLFAAFCIFDIFGAIMNVSEIADILNLLYAILSFVAISGIVIWFKNKQHETSK